MKTTARNVATRGLILSVVVLACAGAVCAGELGSAEVTAFEDVYTHVSPNNGSGPMWSYGCTSIVRAGDAVVVSEMETGEGVPRLCNTRWRLHRRDKTGWGVLAEAEGYRQREPTSLGVTSDGSVYLYVNDSTQPPGTEYGPCEPHLLKFSIEKPGPSEKMLPVWNTETYFTDHSYRGYSTDSGRDELLMLNIDAKTSIQHGCLLDADGKTLANGQIEFPIRACYPQVALEDRAAYVLAVGDIVEPVKEWQTYKFEQTGRKWDYVFRILYFAWTPNLVDRAFAAPIEVANVDATAGHISNQDLWIAPDGSAFILYTEREVQSALMRDKFFPGKSVDNVLHLAVVKDGAIVSRRILAGPERGPGCARFHETPDGRLFVLTYVGAPEPGNELIALDQNGAPTASARKIPFDPAFTSFSLATVRAGNKPSRTIDILGHATAGNILSYGQVQLR